MRGALTGTEQERIIWPAESGKKHPRTSVVQYKVDIVACSSEWNYGLENSNIKLHTVRPISQPELSLASPPTSCLPNASNASPVRPPEVTADV